MWREGSLGIPDGKGGYIICHYWMKVYEKPSKRYGINGGRISKLTIKIDGRVVANYDRGWDIEPADDVAEKAVQILLLETEDEGARLKRQLTTTCSFKEVWYQVLKHQM